jgi:hypothetical protein
MTTEWKDLPTMQDVACAQADDWDIQWATRGDQVWAVWLGELWASKYIFRGRPRQPKMKKVKILSYMHIGCGDIIFRFEAEEVANHWIRIPSEDKIVEIPE